MGSGNSFSPAVRRTLGSGLIVLACLLLAVGWTIPFKFESFSILYKFGFEKALLRSGKMVGITLAVLVSYQVLLASRFEFLNRIYSLKLMLTLHRLNGYLITLLVLTHPVLIKASENFVPYKFESKYYPEFVGIFLLLVVLSVTVPAVLKKYIGLTYAKWLVLHRLGATLALFILPFHVLWVSDTFKNGLPHIGALLLFILNILLVLRIWRRRITS